MVNFGVMDRRSFLDQTGKSIAAGACLSSVVHAKGGAAQERVRPNVVLVMTDDQGFGDLGVHGNPYVRTPHIDQLAKESVEFKQFYVCPVCSPTRSSLMTGRYNYRTGVVDTYLGRSMMHSDEVVIAEMLQEAGYTTGIFGKWHLGDNYPLRAMEHGYDECLLHNGGGLGQPSDPPGNTYFDPILQHNGVPKRYKGYCTDIFTSAAIDFVKKNDGKPFFVYLSTNAPHTPLQIDEKYVQPYRNIGLDDTTAKIYGMVENIDENIGRLKETLREQGLEENTIFIYLTDNGPQQNRYNAGLRGRKGSVYEGGIRVPFYIRWPEKFEAGKKVNKIAAHIDVVPTLCELCGATPPQDRTIDGKSLVPLLTEDSPKWEDRNLFFQWHRGDEPEAFRDCAVRSQRFKLINGKELYDIENDPRELNDVSEQYPSVVEDMRKAYMKWFEDVSSTRGYAPPRIYLGTPHENPVILTVQDWRGPKAGWGNDALGYWEVHVAEEGIYNVTFSIKPLNTQGELHFKLGNLDVMTPVKKGMDTVVLQNLLFKAGDARLEAWVTDGVKNVGSRYVTVKRIS